jgi:uncharacterized protein (DUF1919 family)
LSCDLKFIDSSESRYAEILKLKHQDNVPIGVLDDVEIVFPHYATKDQVKEKWKRRVKRINWNNLIVKFSEQNLFDYEDLKAFDELPYKRKLMFVKQPYPDLQCAIQLTYYKECVSLLSDIHEYRYRMKEIMNVINS